MREHARTAGREALQQFTWRAGSRGPFASHFLAIRVRPAGRRPTERLAADGTLPAVWLLAEWPPQAPEPTDYWLADLPELVRLAKIRWRIEQDYRELKTALGLDHFKGASNPAGTATSPWSPPPSCSHPAAHRPKSGCAGLSLNAVLHQLQALLATWTMRRDPYRRRNTDRGRRPGGRGRYRRCRSPVRCDRSELGDVDAAVP